MKKEINAAELKRRIATARKEQGKSQRPYERGVRVGLDYVLSVVRDMQLDEIEKGQ